jgi:hypothetical protein
MTPLSSPGVSKEHLYPPGAHTAAPSAEARIVHLGFAPMMRSDSYFSRSHKDVTPIWRSVTLVTLLLTTGIATATLAGGQSAVRQRTLALLEAAPPVAFPSSTDSNSPAFWQSFRGDQRLVVINSAPLPIRSAGPNVAALAAGQPVMYNNEINGARWIEAVVPDAVGKLYGYYHNEPAGVCPDNQSKTAPRIGAARSIDGGRTWIDLGIVIEAPPMEPDCNAPNRYFAGGVGDFSVIVDPSGTDLYFLFSTYSPDIDHQGVAVARMLWGDRDAPVGRVGIWSAGVWRYPEATDDGWVYPGATPFLPAEVSWYHRSGRVDAFWGPSIHWNTFLNRHVILLNRAHDSGWGQEGIYVSTTTRLDDPTSWSMPQKIVDGGRWYPQVIGLEHGSGTDRLAGERARFFMGGVSEYEIVFQNRDGVAVPR